MQCMLAKRNVDICVGVVLYVDLLVRERDMLRCSLSIMSVMTYS